MPCSTMLQNFEYDIDYGDDLYVACDVDFFPGRNFDTISQTLRTYKSVLVNGTWGIIKHKFQLAQFYREMI